MSTIVSQPNPPKGIRELHTRPTHLDTSGGTHLDSNPLYTKSDQTRKINETMRSRNVKIAVITNGLDSEDIFGDKALGTSIATQLNGILSGSKALVYEYEITHGEWLQQLCSSQVTYYIFIDLPPYTPSYNATPESEFFNPRSQKITEVVVVRRRRRLSSAGSPRTTAFTPTHYLEKFPHLEGSPQAVAEMALSHFGASVPVPHPSDKVYWSQWPKVHHILKNNHSTLGLSLMTREMAPKSLFPRIVLVKSMFEDCLPALKDCIGKYTHIQSFNGTLLDGLSIADVTAIIQESLTASHVQLIVRYVHPVQAATTNTGLTRNMVPMSTPITPSHPEKPAAERINPSTESLPTPLMILGDMHGLNKELFKYLSGGCGSDDVDSQISSRTENAPRNSASLLVPASRKTRSETSASSCGSMEGSDVAESALFQSDNYVRRLSVSSGLFSSGSFSSPSTTPIRTGHPPTYVRQQTFPHVDKRYILNMFTHEMDRKFVHLFLRQGGIYVVVVSLEDLVEDPVIQFENLSYWLRLVQTHLMPNGIKRVVIVAMSSNSGAPSRQEQECLEHLEGALKDSGFQHVYDRDGSSIIVFDRTKPRSSVEHLCFCIGRCMDAVTTRAWHMHRDFFQNVFHPFSGLTDVLSSISRSPEVLMSADTLQSLYQYAEMNYFDTLAAYSSALISDRLDSLLKPGVLVNLLKHLSLTSEAYKDFVHNIPLLQNLPIVLYPWPKAQILNLYPDLTNQQVISIIKWAEQYRLFYSLGYAGAHEVLFIPLLSTEFLADEACFDWPDGDPDDHWYNQPNNVTHLYAKLGFPATDHFFYSVLTELLKDIVKHNPNHKCYINYGCKEAIVPITVPDVNANITVYLKYHLLQNVIEFRTESRNPVHLFRGVDAKLNAAYLGSKYSSKEWNYHYKNVVSFHIPSDQYDPGFISSATGKLCGLHPPASEGEKSGDEVVFSADNDQLLRMKRVTAQEFEAAKGKRIPADQFLRWGRRLSSDRHNWAMVGTKLNLLSREDVEYFQEYPSASGNGEMVLSKWASSELTYKDLTQTLRSSEVRLDNLAAEIDGFFGTEV